MFLGIHPKLRNYNECFDVQSEELNSMGSQSERYFFLISGV